MGVGGGGVGYHPAMYTVLIGHREWPPSVSFVRQIFQWRVCNFEYANGVIVAA